MRAQLPRWLCIGLIANLALVVALAGWVLAQAFPSSEAVRLRNALLIENGAPADFNWTPERMPAGFMISQRPPYPEFIAAMRASGAESVAGDWHKALALATYLSRNAKYTIPIKSDLVTTLREIVDDGIGYCADYTEVYLALARAAGLTAREWAFSFDGFGGHGHSIIEVFDRQRGRWLFLDVYNNIHGLDAASGEPMSALEFRRRMLGEGGEARIVPNGPGWLKYPHEEKLREYYRRGAAEWYLWWGNAVTSYDAHPLIHAAGLVSRSLEQLVAMAVGMHPRIRVLPTAGNAAQYRRMVALGQQLRWAALALAVLAVTLTVQLVAVCRTWWRRDARGRTGPVQAVERRIKRV